MSVDVLRLKRLYFAALELGAAEQQAFVDAECGEDDELRDELLRLLERSSETDSVLPSPHAGLVESEREPERIGPYRILRRIGAGGMGTVYLAEQAAPIAREVAVKVVRAELVGSKFLERFERERHALARMEHENVARIYDAGETDDGQPYLAMEWVDGEPIRRFCDARRATLRERIELFRQVCAGVQHAHQKGVVHRDLKPDNVLVALRGERVVVKVIDFGLARALEADAATQAGESGPGTAATTSGTLVGSVVGTPEYMAPEQARGEPGAIDTRTDVFALGVILYELLSGLLPVDSDQLRQATAERVRELICGAEPPSPSTRVSSVAGARRSDCAARRQLREQQLSRALRGDLDWIVLRAIQRDPSRRYPSVEALSQDLARYLDGQPVAAAPGGGFYRLRKVLRRRAAAVVGIALVVVTFVVAGLTVRSSFVAAEQHQRRFDELATLSRLERALDHERELVPSWPERLPALRAWQEFAEEQVLRRVQTIRAARDELIDGLEPRVEAAREATRQRHPRYPELERARARREAALRAQAVAAGEVAHQPVAPQPGVEQAPHTDLWSWAMEHVMPDRVVFGDEAEALEVLRVLRSRNPRGHLCDGEMEWLLAWACLANGLVDEARAHSEASLVEAGDESFNASTMARDYGIFQDALRDFPVAVDAADSEVRRLERELIDWQWTDDTDRFLHGSLQEALPRIAELEIAVRRVAQRASWAESVGAASVEAADAARRWEMARAALAAADGVVASRRYAEVPIVLEPQMGLVPLGQNPSTGLWEFYHLRSAWDASNEAPMEAQCALPERDAEGHLVLSPAAGIVFVLIPGGVLATGAEGEQPVAPFFAAAHELTVVQWQCLSEPGRESEAPRPGSLGDHGHVITARQPVAYVDWYESRELLAAHGLRLPSSAEWEWAARGGTTTAWYTGDDAASLVGMAFLGGRLPPGIEGPPRGPIPVGSYPANPFGLHDVYGNVSEWTATRLRKSDGRVRRGAAWFEPPENARSADTSVSQELFRDWAIGLRACRSLRSGGRDE